MHVLAASGDVLTTVIALLAILVGVFVTARGRRGPGAEHGDAKGGSPLLAAPSAAPRPADVEEGRATPAAGDAGDGASGLGAVASDQPGPASEPEPVVQSEPPGAVAPEASGAEDPPPPAPSPPEPPPPEPPPPAR